MSPALKVLSGCTRRWKSRKESTETRQVYLCFRVSSASTPLDWSRWNSETQPPWNWVQSQRERESCDTLWRCHSVDHVVHVSLNSSKTNGVPSCSSMGQTAASGLLQININHTHTRIFPTVVYVCLSWFCFWIVELNHWKTDLSKHWVTCHWKWNIPCLWVAWHSLINSSLLFDRVIHLLS